MLRNSNNIGVVRKRTTNTADVGKRIKLADGTVALPSFSYREDTDTGWYHTGTANTMAATSGGSQVLKLGPSEVTMGGKLVQKVTTRSGAGAIDITGNVCKVTTTGGSQALTLADGVEGQVLTIVYDAEGASTDEATLTPTTANGYTSISLDNVGDVVTLQFNDTTGWAILTQNRAVKPRFCVESSTTHEIGNSADDVVESWGTPTEETGFGSWTGGVLTVDVAGVYLVTASVVFTANSAGQRALYVYDGSARLGYTFVDAASSDVTALTTSFTCTLAAASTLNVQVWQSSGGVLNCGGTGDNANRFNVIWLQD
jgi:hypothetical protein